MKPPHARPDPRYFPPTDPDGRYLHDPERPRESLASLFLGLAAIVVVLLFVVLIVPVLA